ncbi:MAG: hypothetical protein R3B81_04060 [bacterium]
MRLRMFLVGLLTLIAGAPVAAQTARTDSLEVSMAVDVAGGGEFQGYREGGRARGDLPLDSGNGLSLALAWNPEGRYVFELGYRHLDARVDEVDPPTGLEPIGFPVTFDELHLAAEVQRPVGAAQRHRIRGGAIAGLTRFDSDNVTRVRPTFGVGAGTRSRITGRWFLKTNARVRYTITGRKPLLCNPDGDCYPFSGTGSILRWEAGAGIAFLL